eukprot:COSAG01_NODE_6423_length_3674_cov_26.761399_1_plen_29_part_10
MAASKAASAATCSSSRSQRRGTVPGAYLL